MVEGLAHERLAAALRAQFVLGDARGERAARRARHNTSDGEREVERGVSVGPERVGDALRLVYPVHRNPNVSGPARRLLEGLPNVELLPPLDYPEFLERFSTARFALSDSGGVQEEAPTLRVPVLIARETTERPEVLDSGWGVLVGTDPDRILGESRRLLDDEKAYRARCAGPNPFGDGHAAWRIVEALERELRTGCAAAPADGGTT